MLTVDPSRNIAGNRYPQLKLEFYGFTRFRSSSAGTHWAQLDCSLGYPYPICPLASGCKFEPPWALIWQIITLRCNFPDDRTAGRPSYWMMRRSAMWLLIAGTGKHFSR